MLRKCTVRIIVSFTTHVRMYFLQSMACDWMTFLKGYLQTSKDVSFFFHDTHGTAAWVFSVNCSRPSTAVRTSTHKHDIYNLQSNNNERVE